VWSGDPDNRKLYDSLSPDDTPQVLNIAATYEQPFGKGKHFLNQGGVANAILGGWKLNQNWNLQSGVPMYFTSVACNYIYGAHNSCLPDLVGNLAAGRGSKTRAQQENQWYNPNALAPPWGTDPTLLYEYTTGLDPSGNAVDPNTVDAFWRFGNSGLRPPSGRIPGYWDAEELTSFAWDMRLTLSCLQGIANRRRPRLYLLHDRYDELWLDWLRERGDVDAIEWLEVGQVFERFLPDAVPLYVTDPAVPASVNVATMLASVYDGLVATPNTLGLFKLPLGTNTSTLPAGLDLRILGWKKDVDAYRWAFEHLESSLSRQAVCILDPHEVALRDYLVEFKIPVLWVSGPQEVRNNPKSWSEQEVQFAREILMK